MGGVREVLSRSDIDMFHEKPWAILTNLGMLLSGASLAPTQDAGNREAVATRAEREASGPHPLTTP